MAKAKFNLNRWRYVTSRYDGEYVFQCLSCKHKFGEAPAGWRWGSAAFCPYCGTRWDGRVCRPMRRYETVNTYEDGCDAGALAVLRGRRGGRCEDRGEWLIQTQGCGPGGDTLAYNWFWLTDHVKAGPVGDGTVRYVAKLFHDVADRWATDESGVLLSSHVAVQVVRVYPDKREKVVVAKIYGVRRAKREVSADGY